MDSLDDPVLPAILSALGANLARSGALGPGGGVENDVSESIRHMQRQESSTGTGTIATSSSESEAAAKGKGKGKGVEADGGAGVEQDEREVGTWSDARAVLKRRLDTLSSSVQPAAASASTADIELAEIKHKLASALHDLGTKGLTMGGQEYQQLLFRAVSVMVASPRVDSDVLHYLVQVPMTALTPLAISAGVGAWGWLLRQHPEARDALVAEIAAGWAASIKLRKGLFNPSLNYDDPFARPIEYSPSDPAMLDRDINKARKLLRPHAAILQFLTAQVQAAKYRGNSLMVTVLRFLTRSFASASKMSTHPLAREIRFQLVQLGLQVLANGRLEALVELRLRDRLYTAAFHWFSVRPQWSHSLDLQQADAEIRLLVEVQNLIKADRVACEHVLTSFPSRAPPLRVNGSVTLEEYRELHPHRVRLLMLLVENEIGRLSVWKNPLNEADRAGPSVGQLERAVKNRDWAGLVQKAWKLLPAMAVHMGERFKHAPVQAELSRLVRLSPRSVVKVPEAVRYLIGDHVDPSARAALKWLPLWSALPPVSALTYFDPRYGNHPLILQYAMRVLEQHPVELVFFFVPQIVQALRTDESGYVEQFIFQTSKISQLFCHQIIWNMKANTYKDDNATEADPMKPLLDRMIDMIVAGLSGKAKAFYDLEFDFFDEVTSISGKLKPYIKKEKPEKKAKIDEEMAKIKLSVGVYLPSNPDGSVVDIDRKSGRPLQSHAKAPFMATFKVRREVVEVEGGGKGDGAAGATGAKDGSGAVDEEEAEVKRTHDVWQSAIFKVGDDCRQDVLALQVIAMFKNAFWSVGLDLYLFPYRVTATAPGCGVIDVVPNSTSRDEMGRQHINDLNAYCINKYGGEETAAYQKARLNFIRSMAAYSVACYILQIKDRHNGNIMIDDQGHIIHIDFGFLFDIGPGGIKFEPNSFKLNREMVALMGGSDSQGFRLFNELTVKAFLAIRPHADQLVDTVHLMLGTGLPSFKGEPTIQRLRNRFQLQLSERQAAEYMQGVIRNAHENFRSGFYDRFQHYQNGIPY